MKKVITILVAFVVSANVFCQTIPNAGFENWTGTEPDGWTTLNALQSLNGSTDYCVEKGIPGATGNSHIKLTTKDIDTSSSVYKFGGAASTDIASTLRPSSLSGSNKCLVMFNDTAAVVVDLRKWNNTNHQRESIGRGVQIYTGLNIATWSYFSIPISYMSNNTPDTISITLMSSIGDSSHMVLGDVLEIDNLAFSGNNGSGIMDNNSENEFSVYPNPTSSTATLTNTLNKSISISNINGQSVINLPKQTGSIATIDISHLAEGVYFVTLRSDEGVVTKKIVKRN